MRKSYMHEELSPFRAHVFALKLWYPVATIAKRMDESKIDVNAYVHGRSIPPVEFLERFYTVFHDDLRRNGVTDDFNPQTAGNPPVHRRRIRYGWELASLFKAFDRIYPLSAACKDDLTNALEEYDFPRRRRFYVPAPATDRIYFVRRGLVYSHADHGKTICFFKEGDLCFSARGFFARAPSDEGFRTIKASLLYGLSYDNFRDIYRKFPEFSIVIGEYVQRHLIASEERISNLHTMWSPERYARLLARYPDQVTHIFGKLIAGYIGITPQMFSRVKNKKRDPAPVQDQEGPPDL